MLRRECLLLCPMLRLRKAGCSAQELAKSCLSDSVYIFHGSERSFTLRTQRIVKQVVMVQMYRGELPN